MFTVSDAESAAFRPALEAACMTPKQARDARLLLGWSVAKLASRSSVGWHAVYGYKQTGRMPAGRERALRLQRVAAIRNALETAGIEFKEQTGGVPQRLIKKGGVTPIQCKEARCLLGWSSVRLAAQIGTDYHVTHIFETTGGMARSKVAGAKFDRTAALRAVLEAAGVEFIEGDQPGVKPRAEHVDE